MSVPSLFEPRVRRVVAETLGVDPEELSPHVSLTDDLAADSLDLTEVAVRLENDLGIVLADGVVEYVRTYGDLLRAALASSSSRPVAAADMEPIPLWSRLVSTGGELVRAELLTPYVAEMLADDALRAGRGARLDIRLGPAADESHVAGLRRELAWLGRHGVDVSIARRRTRETGYPTAA